jgi:hypothetical protein
MRQEFRPNYSSSNTLHQKKSLLLSQVQSGVNLPPLTAKNKKSLKFALKDLFTAEIKPILKEMLPLTEDWESWLSFEGIYDDALEKIRNLILFTKGVACGDFEAVGDFDIEAFAVTVAWLVCVGDCDGVACGDFDAVGVGRRR